MKANIDIKTKIKNKKCLNINNNKILKKNDKNKKAMVSKKKGKKSKKQKRAESAKEIVPETTKKFKRLNAYNDVSRIISFIDGSRKNSQSKICRSHYENIQVVKNMDKSLKKMIEKNEIFK